MSNIPELSHLLVFKITRCVTDSSRSSSWDRNHNENLSKVDNRMRLSNAGEIIVNVIIHA
ncbi:hypothetical protein TSUD_93910 [Trifolium subterraneum]|uniref:Uncharacterized protein n=1 Tax=Trifolium subterraneum TaxID=3900 RepID=A0A2Z6NC14_TRISU|nr:hypothetical protein TSUD_93910 [Trifolium subterraneum]